MDWEVTLILLTPLSCFISHSQKHSIVSPRRGHLAELGLRQPEGNIRVRAAIFTPHLRRLELNGLC